MRLRSLLYVPADNERFIARAHERGADAIILDLEDSVRPERRVAARDRLQTSVDRVRRGGGSVLVRVNVETMLDDARAAQTAGAHALVVPKAEPGRIQSLADALGGGLDFLALVEDPGAVLDARVIAAHPRVLGLAVGGEDLATTLGAEPDGDTLRIPKLLVHYAAKAHGKLSLGLFGTIADYADTDAIRRWGQEARRHGFDGATCVHPSAVAVLNATFSPSAEKVDWARRVLAAAETEAGGAFVVDGRMIDAPVVERARRIIERSDAAGG